MILLVSAAILECPRGRRENAAHKHKREGGTQSRRIKQYRNCRHLHQTNHTVRMGPPESDNDQHSGSNIRKENDIGHLFIPLLLLLDLFTYSRHNDPKSQYKYYYHYHYVTQKKEVGL
jgi:hypothetical protein